MLNIALAAFGSAIGLGILEAIRKKYGRIPWQFTATIWVVIALHVWLAWALIGRFWPFN